MDEDEGDRAAEPLLFGGAIPKVVAPVHGDSRIFTQPPAMAPAMPPPPVPERAPASDQRPLKTARR
eukprot:9834295-Prorocentrum_lima.AAC.1